MNHAIVFFVTNACIPDQDVDTSVARVEPYSDLDSRWRTRVPFVVKSRSYASKCLALIAFLHANFAFGEEVAKNRVVEFRAVGVVSISRGNDKSSDRAFNFEAFVKGNRWLIHTESFDFLTNKSSTGIEYYQAGTDGTNVYSAVLFNAAYDLRHSQEDAMVSLKEEEARLVANGGNPQDLFAIRREIDTLSRQLTATQTMPEPRNKAFGEIIVGVIPRFSVEDLIAPIWLALCSQSVIGATKLAPGLFHSRNGDEPLSSELFVDAEVRNSLRFPHLPEFVGFSNKAIWVAKKTGIRTKIKPPNGLDDPFQEATYEATLSSYGGLALPSAFEIKRYSSSRTSGRPQLSYLITGRVTEVFPSIELADFLPHLPVVAAVADYRHIDDNIRSSVRVFTKPGEWPSVETVQRTKEYSRTLDQAVKGTSNSRFRRTTILFSLASLSAALAVLAWKTKTGKKHG